MMSETEAELMSESLLSGAVGVFVSRQLLPIEQSA